MNALKYFQSKIEKLSDLDLVMVEGRVHEHWQPHSSLKPCHVINEHLPPWASNSSYCQQCLLERLYDVDLVMTEGRVHEHWQPHSSLKPSDVINEQPPPWASNRSYCQQCLLEILVSGEQFQLFRSGIYSSSPSTSSVTRLGDFFKFLLTNYLRKVAILYGDFLA